MPSIYEIAKKAGVSSATVSRVVNNSSEVKKETRERVMKVLRQMKYHPHAGARSLRTKRTRAISLIIPDIENQFYPALARGAQDRARQLGYYMLLCNTDEEENEEILYMKMMREHHIDGFIITPAGSRVNNESNEYLLRLQKDGFPSVMIGHRLEEPQMDMVTVHTEESSYEAVKHLIRLGHQRIGLLAGPLSKGMSKGRFRGYKRALIEHGIEIEENLVVETDLHLESGYERMKQLLSMVHRPSGVFAVNDTVAIGAMRAISEKKLKIPRDIAIVGFDDIPLASMVKPSLTTVAQPKYEMGRMAVELLINRIEKRVQKPQRIRLKARLVIRESTIEKEFE